MKGWNKYTFKITTILILIILFYNFTNIFFIDNSCKAKEGNILFVGGIEFGNYNLIQDAIDNASASDTIFVYEGIYNESIVINKSINLIGEDENLVILDSSQNIYSILIQSSWVNISGFNIQNSQIGVFIIDLGYGFINISENIFINNHERIRIYNSYNITIFNNVIHNNSAFGIVMYETKNNEIIGNNITQNFRAINLGRWSNFNKIFKNNCSENELGINIVYSFNNSIVNNEIRYNKWGFYLKNSKNNSITNNNIEFNNNAGIIIENSEENIFEPNYFNENSVDIRKKASPPKIKTPGFEIFLLFFGIFVFLVLKKFY